MVIVLVKIATHRHKNSLVPFHGHKGYFFALIYLAATNLIAVKGI